MQQIILSCDRCGKTVDHLYNVSLKMDTSEYNNKLLDGLLIGEDDEEAKFMIEFVDKMGGQNTRELCVECSRMLLNLIREFGYFNYGSIIRSML